MSHQRTKRNPKSQRHSGIILLVVLGMLTLFSMLGASYLVFTNSQLRAATSINFSERQSGIGEEFLDRALSGLLVGATGPESSLWGHSLLGDFYGVRDGVTGQVAARTAWPVNNNLVRPDIMLSGEFVRFPSQLHSVATYVNRRLDADPKRLYPSAAATAYVTDEEITGRILTFDQGPLQGLSMRVVRYFGDHTGAANNRAILSGQVVLDMRPHLGKDITIASLGETFTLGEWVRRHQLPTANTDHRNISLLFYDAVPETTNDPLVLSAFHLNGRILNGPGLGWDVERDNTLTESAPAFNLNETIRTQYDPTIADASLVPTNVKEDAAFEASATGNDVPVSLQGNFALYRRQPAAVASNATHAYIQDLPPGDQDEPYDAPDEQNWFLSHFPTTAAMGTPTPSFVRPGILNWLLNQHSATASLDSLPIARLRQIARAVQRASFRPIRTINDPSMPTAIPNRAPGVLELDYSQFTGSNLSALGTTSINFTETDPAVLADQIRTVAQALVGPIWDVDNNGDNILDGVWIDAGLSLTETDDGKLIKPLVSYLVEDLSGRLDVNLIGNLAQARSWSHVQPNVNRIVNSTEGLLWNNGTPTGGDSTEPNLAGAVPPYPVGLPNGFGYGPAEIDLRPLFFHVNAQDGNGALELLRRRLLRQEVSGTEYVASGFLIDQRTGTGNDFLGMLRQPFLPNLHATNNAYGLPVDKFGRASIGLGINGGLLVSGASAVVANGGAAAGDSNDDPYEMERNASGQPDSAFSLSDLEAILRYNDFDRDALESELVYLSEEYFDDPNSFSVTNPVGVTGPTYADVQAARQEFANSITTVSNTTAIAKGILPREYRDNAAIAQGSGAPQDLLTEEVANGMLTNQQRNALLMQLLPKDLLAGKKFDLNRPFGNGIDDDGDGVIDDPQELIGATETFYQDFTGTLSNTVFTTAFTDSTNGIPGPGTGNYEPSSRELFARHLYVMAMTLARNNETGTDFDFSYGTAGAVTIDPTQEKAFYNNGSGAYRPATAEEQYRAYRLAQWAINVVDFRDPDAIMSRFRYDVDPFNGWHVEDVTGGTLTGPTPTFGVVWGAEYPELALDESLAFHDRRVRDTALDPTTAPRFDGNNFDDNDVDQFRIPQGSLFLEIRSTRAPDQLRVLTDDRDDSARPWAVPAELYGHLDIDGGGTINAGDEFGLDLARRPAGDRNPVWRVAITRAHPGFETTGAGASDPELSADEMLQPVGTASTLNPYQLAASQRLNATLDPLQPSMFGPRIPDAIERVVWFTNEDPDDGGIGDATAGDGIVDFAPPSLQETGRIFYNRFQASSYPYQDTSDSDVEVYLRGGQYAVVGPRAVTNVGSLQVGTSGATHDAASGEPIVPYADYESPQRFEMNSGFFSQFSIAGTRITPTVDVGSVAFASIRPVVGVIAAANAAAAWTGPRLAPNAMIANPFNIGLGLSASEPLNIGGSYYQAPTEELAPGFPTDSYYNYDTSTGAFPDQPFDERATAELFQVFGVNGSKTGTRERFKTAYLQRLADPTQPFDAIDNPYRTVDYITIDLTVFNGSDSNTQETSTGAVPMTEWIDTNNPAPLASDPPEAFASRYKTGRTLFSPATAGSAENLSHSVNTFPPALTAAAPTATGGNTAFFNRSLSLQDLVNPDVTTSTAPTAVDAYPIATAHSSTLGYSNASYGERLRRAASPSATPLVSTGLPYNNSFTSAIWLNRSFVSPLEMAWVPSTSAAGLVTHFGTPVVPPNYTGVDFYSGTGALVNDRQEINAVFPHLFNFASTDADFTTTPNLWRLLDWVDVPAPFDFENDFISTNNDLLRERANTIVTPDTFLLDEVGESAFGNVLNYAALSSTTATGNPDTWDNATAGFWMNRWIAESFRAPNNILAPDFRHGKVNLNTIKSAKVYESIMQGISGEPPIILNWPTPPATATNGTPPTQPFLTEFLQERRGYNTPTTTGEALGPDFNREHPTTFAGAFKPTSVGDLSVVATERGIEPIDRTIMRSGAQSGGANLPLFIQPMGAGTTRSNWAERSVLHQQLPMTRLSNLTTDQSNVFAVWITVGLFEVNTANNGVGQEVGSDSGNIRRYRSFHIIDRSVPVRFEQGALHNALDTVKLSRVLN